MPFSTQPRVSAVEQARSAASLFGAIASSPELCDALDQAAQAMVDCLKRGGCVFSCGNGGSATDANHLAEELVGRYKLDRRPLPAVCLNVDAGALTCIANDYGFEEIFARQVRALAGPGDLLVVFSTSGNSPNILRALEAAEEKGAATLALLGKDGGKAREAARMAVVAPSPETARVQEAHALFLHILCQAADDAFAPAPES
jgi:D-sedoheptulose 7-phosphate isomerase